MLKKVKLILVFCTLYVLWAYYMIRVEGMPIGFVILPLPIYIVYFLVHAVISFAKNQLTRPDAMEKVIVPLVLMLIALGMTMLIVLTPNRPSSSGNVTEDVFENARRP